MKTRQHDYTRGHRIIMMVYAAALLKGTQNAHAGTCTVLLENKVNINKKEMVVLSLFVAAQHVNADICAVLLQKQQI